MENEENRYARGKIYSIRSHQTNDIYIGSTIDDLPKRLYNHKAKYRSFMNEKSSYVTSYEIVKYEDCYIELVENFPCNSKNELYRKEGEIIRGRDCVNKVIAGQTYKEFYENNKEKIALRKKEHYENNKEQYLLKKKEYNEKNKELLSLKAKEYRKNNKEKVALYNKERREKKITSYSTLSLV